MKQHGLLQGRPTIYKMINSGVGLHPVVKHGKVLKLLIHQSY